MALPFAPEQDDEETETGYRNAAVELTDEG
jgi:hypothetical protein